MIKFAILITNSVPVPYWVHVCKNVKLRRFISISVT